jgi:exopolysaccharide biosynthesis polyprenyl glycosylphosphotransferase
MGTNEVGAGAAVREARGTRRRVGSSRATSSDPWPIVFIQLISDVLALVLAWHAAIGIRLLLNPYMSLHLTRDELVRLSPSLEAVLVSWIVASCWLHRSKQRSGSFFSGAVKTVESMVTVTSIIIICAFFSATLGTPVSRSIVLFFAAVSGVFLSFARIPGRLLTNFALDWVLPPKRVAVLGSEDEASRLVNRISEEADIDIRVVGIILPRRAQHDPRKEGVRVLGDSNQLAAVINREQLNGIIMVTNTMTASEANECGIISKRMGVTVSRAIGQEVSNDIRVRLTNRYGMHWVEQQPVSFTRRQELIKWLFDLIVAAAVLLLLSPGLAVFALLVKLTSQGPVLYRSPRVGKGGRYFNFLKFRSMYWRSRSRDAVATLNERSGHIFKIRNDPRITPVGWFMRRYSIDELPQLFNVLCGEMSLLGPRPLPAEDLDPDGMSKEFSFWAEQRARVLPGITGLWQIRGRSDLSFEEMMELDTYYIRNWSLLLDLKILIATPAAVISGRGAY